MRAGIDLGGTKIEIAVLDEQNGIVLRERAATPGGTYQDTIDAIAGLLAGAEATLGVRIPRFGVATPGSISPATGLIRNANSTRLNGHPLDRDLADATGRNVRVENDANCFAVAEARLGAAQGRRLVYGIILGTGVGAGIVVNQRVLMGANAIAGEWGHNPLPWPRRRWARARTPKRCSASSSAPASAPGSSTAAR